MKPPRQESSLCFRQIKQAILLSGNLQVQPCPERSEGPLSKRRFIRSQWTCHPERSAEGAESKDLCITKKKCIGPSTRPHPATPGLGLAQDDSAIFLAVGL